jgi:hypothetical protein
MPVYLQLKDALEKNNSIWAEHLSKASTSHPETPIQVPETTSEIILILLISLA